MSVDRIHHTAVRRPRAAPPPLRRRHRARVWIVVGIFLGFVALAWAWAFQRGSSHGGADVPVLAAGDQPTREKPADPGGMKVADIDPLAYDSGRAPPKVENILPPPEAPLPQPAPDPKPVAAAPPAPATPVQSAQATTTTPNPAPAPTQLAAAVPTPAPSAAPAHEAAPPPPVPAVKPIPKVKPAAFREEAKPLPKPAKSFETGTDGYRVQLASFHSEADAHAAAAKLRGNLGGVLGGAGLSVVSVDLGGRGTFFRIMAGPMKEGAARHLCDALRQRGTACLLARH